jgi:hypothetical protein
MHFKTQQANMRFIFIYFRQNFTIMKNLVIIMMVVFTANVAFAQSWLPVNVSEKTGENKVEISADGKPFTCYIWPNTLKKPVLWPVVAPAGQTVTRHFPLAVREGERADHPHHVGIWLNFGDVNGLDFWNNSEAIPADRAKNYGTILHKSVDRIKNNRTDAELAVTAAWVDIDGKVLLNEKSSFTFRATKDYRIIDRQTTLTAANGEVKFTDNKEGMFAIRVTTELELPSEGAVQLTDAKGNITRVEKPDLSRVTGNYLSSEGITGGAVWGTRGCWMKLSGKMEGKDVSVIIIDHPMNPGYPTYWHARGYGLFAANTLGQKALSDGKDELNFSLANGKSVTFRYRLIISDGNPTVETINGWTEEWKNIK